MKRFALIASVVACGGGSKSVPQPAPAPPPAPEPVAAAPAPVIEDPYLWLEQVEDPKSLAWVKERSDQAKAALAGSPVFHEDHERFLSILTAKDKMAVGSKIGRWIYNFWTDDKNPRGVWRRTTFADYQKPAPRWETVLDIDALNQAEHATWVLKGEDCLYPKFERCLIVLSRGGGDATVVREFDVVKKTWVKDGFVTPEAKTDITWKDRDTVYIATNFGPGTTSAAGYALVVKEWKRGTPLSAATQIFQADAQAVAASAYRQWDHNHTHDIIGVETSTFTSDAYLWDGKTATKIDKPNHASVQFWDDQMLFRPQKDWVIGSVTWPAGSLLAIKEKDYLAGKRELVPLFTPTPTSSFAGLTVGKTRLLVQSLDDVKDGLVAWTKPGGTWKSTKLALPTGISSRLSTWDDDENDDYWIYESGYLTPATYSLVRDNKKLELKHSPARFDATALEVQQHFVTSKDGTRVPYYQVSKKGMPLDGSAPAIIEGYGGFEISLTPGYSAITGAGWLEKGGVFVEPNLRGGGEYGPTWHLSAIKHDRQRVYDDFAAIAEDLIQRKVTSPKKLGIVGGSNGGLLVGVMMTERPELFGAVVCQQPLLDMKRYHKLLAGASWMDEYGNPDDPADWAAIAKYSPYQNVKPDVKMPPVLFTTSTRDDRVHPGHARKMAADDRARPRRAVLRKRGGRARGGGGHRADRIHAGVDLDVPVEAARPRIVITTRAACGTRART